MKTLLNFYITSSIHVSLAVTALVYATYFFNQTTPDFLLLLFVMLATISGYNFIKYAGMAKWYHKRLPQQVRWIQIFSLLCFLGLAVVVYVLPLNTQKLIALLAVITGLYTIPVWPKFKNLRSIAGLKIFVVGLVWAATAVLLPLWHEQLPLNADNIALAIQLFLIVIGLTIPFEIRDLDHDRVALQTLPQWLGIKTTKRVGVACFVIAMGLDLFKDEWILAGTIFWAFIAVFGIVSVLKSTLRHSVYFASFWVESIPIWGGLGLFLYALAFA